MQTSQRRIPIGGDDGKNKTWEELLVHYKKEFTNFQNNLVLLKSKQSAGAVQKRVITSALPAANIKLNGSFKTVKLAVGVSLYNDIESDIEEIAPELVGLNGLLLNSAEQSNNGTTLEFENTEPVKLLVGFFRDDQRKYAKAPTLETDAAANLYGQADPVLLNAMKVDDLPAINVHAYSFKAGKNKLLLPKGFCLVLGFTNTNITPRNAGLAGIGDEATMDWMFY